MYGLCCGPFAFPLPCSRTGAPSGRTTPHYLGSRIKPLESCETERRQEDQCLVFSSMLDLILYVCVFRRGVTPFFSLFVLFFRNIHQSLQSETLHGSWVRAQQLSWNLWGVLSLSNIRKSIMVFEEYISVILFLFKKNVSPETLPQFGLSASELVLSKLKALGHFWHLKSKSSHYEHYVNQIDYQTFINIHFSFFF